MNISGTQSRKYPYGGKIVTEDSRLYRFMNVNLAKFLGNIAGKVILRNKNNWKADLEKIINAITSKNPEDKRLVWLVSGSGTHLNTEYETFIEDTPASRHMKENSPKEDDLFGYIIEVTGTENGIIKGNVFEIGDLEDYAWYVRNTAVPLDSVTITYTDGRGGHKDETVSHYEYARDYKKLIGGSAIVSDICYHPNAYRQGMSGLLDKERENRMALPVGSVEAHIEKLTRKLADLRGYEQMEIPHKPVMRIPAAKEKPSIAAALKVADLHAKRYNQQKALERQTNMKKMKKETVRNG